MGPRVYEEYWRVHRKLIAGLIVFGFKDGRFILLVLREAFGYLYQHVSIGFSHERGAGDC